MPSNQLANRARAAAVGGYSAYQTARSAYNLYKSMRDVSNRVTKFRSDRASKKRPRPGKSTSLYRYKRAKLVSGRGDSGGPAADDYFTGGTRRGKLRKQVKKRVVKLKPAMKAAIKRLLAPGDVSGKYTKKAVSFLWFGGTPEKGGSTFDNKQKVGYLGVPFAFTPNSFNEAASILWRNRPEPGNSSPAYDTTLDFLREGLKMVVIDSSCHVTFRNNSKRTYKLKFFICAPKKIADLEPKGDLDTRLTEMNEGTNLVNNGSNVLSNNYEKLGLDPRSIPGWSAGWSHEVVDILLQPGQTHMHVVQGPKWLDMDWNKYLNGGAYIEQQKFMRYMFVIFHTDLLGTSGVGGGVPLPGTMGYYCEDGDVATGQFDGYGVAVDQTFHYHIKMPEQTGHQVEAAPANGEQALTKRRNAFAYSDYIAGRVGTLERIDDEAGGAIEAH